MAVELEVVLVCYEPSHCDAVGYLNRVLGHAPLVRWKEPGQPIGAAVCCLKVWGVAIRRPDPELVDNLEAAFHSAEWVNPHMATLTLLKDNGSLERVVRDPQADRKRLPGHGREYLLWCRGGGTF